MYVRVAGFLVWKTAICWIDGIRPGINVGNILFVPVFLTDKEILLLSITPMYIFYFESTPSLYFKLFVLSFFFFYFDVCCLFLCLKGVFNKMANGTQNLKVNYKLTINNLLNLKGYFPCKYESIFRWFTIRKHAE